MIIEQGSWSRLRSISSCAFSFETGSWRTATSVGGRSNTKAGTSLYVLPRRLRKNSSASLDQMLRLLSPLGRGFGGAFLADGTAKGIRAEYAVDEVAISVIGIGLRELAAFSRDVVSG